MTNKYLLIINMKKYHIVCPRKKKELLDMVRVKNSASMIVLSNPIYVLTKALFFIISFIVVTFHIPGYPHGWEFSTNFYPSEEE